MIDIQRANERGSAEHGWLHTHFSFSFGDYYNQDRMNFGALRVLNDDTIDGGAGFPMHPHANMEIVTIVLEGALKHSDSMGNKGNIPAGDVQRMSAGTGITHSEANASKTVQAKLLQIWVIPREQNIEPSYEQKSFDKKERKNKFQIIVSPTGKGLHINQDAYFLLGEFDKGKEASYKLTSTEHGVYVFIIKGKVKINGEELNERDAAGITETEKIELKALSDSEVLLIEVPA